MKKKFVLEFDEEPSLVFVQHKAGDMREANIWQDGEQILDCRHIQISAGMDEMTTHKIEHVTGAAKYLPKPELDFKVVVNGPTDREKLREDAKELARLSQQIARELRNLY